MSYSRLEKFIYAICSMEVTDLPVPLSRIEKLWNCLITGETPDFEPLSRNEKYLMAMLDRYDISNLPAPMSRGEKLLYKIAMGETDLSDVPGYLSRYEELLKYLIENGGISGGDFEYVLYTLNQSLYTLYTTAEKPVKKAIIYGDTLVNTLQESSSLAVTPMGEAIDAQQATVTGTANGAIKNAILTGQTLVNLVDSSKNYLIKYNSNDSSIYTINKVNNSSINITQSVLNTSWRYISININLSLLKANTKYLIVGDNMSNISSVRISRGDGANTLAGSSNIINNKYTILTTNDLSTLNNGQILYVSISNTTTYPSTISISNVRMIEYVEGMENWDIPYFEGMQSVKMPVLTTTGKNLFNNDDIIVDGYIISNGNLVYQTNDNRNATNFIEVMPNTTYTLSGIKNSAINGAKTHMYVGTYDKNKNFIKTFGILCGNDYEKFTTEENTQYVRFTVRNEDLNRLQLEQGTLRTSYEPYKSNILTVNEDVELRGIGNVQDTLDCLTGKAVNNFSIYQFSDTDEWSTNTEKNAQRFTLNVSPLPIGAKYSSVVCILNDKLTGVKWNQSWNTVNTIACSNSVIAVHLPLGTTIEQCKELMRNSIAIYRTTESVKTVDLTIQDQDGNTVPHLQAFNETTHITTSSTGLFPNVVIPATVSYPSIIKPRMLYTVKLKRSVTSGTLMINVGGTEQAVTSDCFTITTPATLTSQDVIFSRKGNVISEVTVVEGDQTAKEYGYFEGMQSVKMPVLTTTGKNLFNPNETKPGFFYDKSEIQEDYHELFPCLKTNNLKPNTKYTVSARYSLYIAFFDKNEISLGYFDTNTGNVLTTPNNTYYTLLRSHKSISSGIAYNSLDEFKNDVQIEEGSIATSYEPYKSNTLTINEDLELRKVGDVRDELDAKTGEVIERVGEIMLDGSEKWTIHSGNNWQRYSTEIPSMIDIYDFKNSNRTHCDKLTYDINDAKNSGSYLRAHKNIVIYNNEIVRNIEQFKRWLSRNPITIQYELAESTNKSIDISTVDQDNQPTELRTFENITHVSLEAENLIPEVEMEVATNLLEDTVFNLMDAFNTLYPTAAKPVVDGKLYGQTLVNISSLSGEITIKPNSAQYIESSLIEQNKTYTFMFDCTSAPSTGTIEIRQILDNTQVTENTINVTQGYNKFKLKTSSKEINKFRLKNPNTSETDFVFNNLLIIEGDYINIDIPYFEGMQSVQAPGITMTGKNLFDGVSYIDGYIFPSGGSSTTTNVIRDSNVTSILVNVDKNTDYILSTKTSFDRGWVAGSLEPIKIGSKVVVLDHDTVSNTIRFNSGEYTYIMIYLNSIKIDIEEIQVEKGTAATPYEPYKSITLSTPSDLELRKVGEVQDEMNVMTGEVVERIGKMVLDGSESWSIHSTGTNTVRFVTYDKLDNLYYFGENTNMFTYIMCDTFSPVESNASTDTEGLQIYSNKNGRSDLKLRILNTKASTIDELKAYLTQHPITIQYRAKENTKTINLTIINQDGNETKLTTFDDTTHVLLESEAGPNPGASLTVRTKIPSASSTSLLMDDISTDQQQLESTVNEQSNNVDATMIATTEIYEETL